MLTRISSVHWLLAMLATQALLLSGCGAGSDDVPSASIVSQGGSATDSVPPKHPVDQEPFKLLSNGQIHGREFQSPAQSQQEFFPEVVIKTNMGDIRLKLNGDKSPRTVINFLENYVDSGFYDRTVFHYVESGYMIAGGGYTEALQEKQTQPPIPCEANNGLSNKRGTIAMARHPDFAHSATSQFYINVVDNLSLDHQPTEVDGVNGYCVFGEVIEGMDVVEKISQVPVHDQGDFMNTPVQPVIVETIAHVK